MQPNRKNHCQLNPNKFINMKKFLVFGLVSLVFLGCIKSSNSTPACTDVDPSAEATMLRGYCISKGIDYTVDSSGIYYQVIDAGTGQKPSVNSLVTTTYIGQFLDGKVLDSNLHGYTNNLNQLIPAWQIGLQKIGKGGHIKMVAPSSLCYGCYGVPPRVPSNAILYFDITLLDVQ
jgi:FKBP-type peptidyl-prolyl cis-trans isomerase FkpA